MAAKHLIAAATLAVVSTPILANPVTLYCVGELIFSSSETQYPAVDERREILIDRDRMILSYDGREIPLETRGDSTYIYYKETPQHGTFEETIELDRHTLELDWWKQNDLASERYRGVCTHYNPKI